MKISFFIAYTACEWWDVNLEGDILNSNSAQIPLKKKQKCLDCGDRPVILTYNVQSGIYEGARICKSCRQSPRRQYANFEYPLLVR